MLDDGEPWKQSAVTPSPRSRSTVFDEAAHRREVLGGELRHPELPDLDEPLADLVVRGRDAVAEPLVPVPLDDGTAERQNAGQRLGRLRADGDVAQADETVELLALELGEDGLEREQVAVRIRDDADPLHEPSSRSRLAAALIRARCVNACGKFPSSSPVAPISSE